MAILVKPQFITLPMTDDNGNRTWL